MAERLPTFDAARDRNDLRRASQRLNQFWPNRSVRVDIFKRFASSIRIANEVSAAAWSVTLLAKSIRLNVGQTEVLTASPDGIEVLVKAAGRKPYYAAVKVGSQKIFRVPKRLSAVSRSQWNAHAAYIKAAALAKSRTPHASSFSESVLNVIESALGETLPRPSHQHRPLHILQGGVKNGDRVWLEKASRLGLKSRSWVVPKHAKTGDDAIIYVGKEFFTVARIAGGTRPKPDRHRRYGAPIDNVNLLTPPIPLDEIKRLLPELTWAIQPRSIHTVEGDLARKIRSLLVADYGPSDAEIEQDRGLKETEREAVILARRGQGQFRADLLKLWGTCSVTRTGPVDILKASHIKRWADCSHRERLDLYNGLLLLPNLDALFDRHLISFDESGKIQISHQLEKKHWSSLGLSPRMGIRLQPRHREYLNHHRSRFVERQK